MIKIAYPDYKFRVVEKHESRHIFDELRRVWLKLTPEEWVRQNFIRFLVDTKQYPAALIALEKKIMVGELSRRFDILVYNNSHRPWMMVECKAMNVQLSEDVLAQVLRYNSGTPVQYIVITNGTHCMAFEKKNMQLVPLNELPAFGN